MYTFIIFGASGDLTRRKLIPALYRSVCQNQLPGDTRIVGVSRSPLTDDVFRQRLADSTKQFAGDDFAEDTWTAFARGIHYLAGDIENVEDFRALSVYLHELDGGQSTRIFYLATSPSLYEAALENLGAAEHR